MSYIAGDRIVAGLSLDDGPHIVSILGVGTCMGLEPTPEEIAGPLCSPSYRVRLDSGQDVWGYECGLLPEQVLDDWKKKGREVVVRDLAEFRRWSKDLSASLVPGTSRAAVFLDGIYHTKYGPMTPEQAAKWKRDRGFDPTQAVQPVICWGFQPLAGGK